MKQSEIFARAREVMAGGRLIKDRGWVECDGFCTRGALMAVFGFADSFELIRMDGGALTETLSKVLGVHSIESWNDRPETTHLDAVVALEKAHLYALDLESRGELPEVEG